MQIKILGSGCSNCVKLAKNTQEALDKLGRQADIIKVTDFKDIAAYGVMATPALVIDEQVVSYGKVLKPSAIQELIEKL